MKLSVRICVTLAALVLAAACSPPASRAPETTSGAGERACTRNEDCADTAFCYTPPGACGEPGVCRPRPEVCTQVYDPVCGCDGRTYSNACMAALSGVNVAAPGPCQEPAGLPGG